MKIYKLMLHKRQESNTNNKKNSHTKSITTRCEKFRHTKEQCSPEIREENPALRAALKHYSQSKSSH